MMGMTHVFAGTMSAVMLTKMDTTGDCLAALIGGALGAVACDMDLGRYDNRRETTRAGWTAGIVALSCLAADIFLNAGLIRRLQNTSTDAMAVGMAGLAVLFLWGRGQPHRGATHSLLMTALMGLCVKLVCAPVSIPFMIGMASHMVLDMLNRRPVRLLYPFGRGLCLRICRADGSLDRMIRTAAVLGTVFALGINIGNFT